MLSRMTCFDSLGCDIAFILSSHSVTQLNLVKTCPTAMLPSKNSTFGPNGTFGTNGNFCAWLRGVCGQRTKCKEIIDHWMVQVGRVLDDWTTFTT